VRDGADLISVTLVRGRLDGRDRHTHDGEVFDLQLRVTKRDNLQMVWRVTVYKERL